MIVENEQRSYMMDFRLSIWFVYGGYLGQIGQHLLNRLSGDLISISYSIHVHL